MVIKLYLDYCSQPSRAVWAFMLLNKIPHELVQIKIAMGQTRSQEYALINPLKKVPAIVDTDNDNFTLVQSHAIMKYLNRRFTCSQQWYPKNDDKRAALIDSYLDFHHTGFHSSSYYIGTRKCSYLIFNSLFAKRFNMVDPSFIPQQALKDVEYALKTIDKKLLNNTYIVGDKPSMADLAAFFQIQFLILLNYDFTKWKGLSRWMEYMKAIKEIQQVNQKFYQFASKVKAAKPKL